MNKESVVSKVWSFCNVLRDDGVSYTDYIEQMTFLLFLKMADEYSKAPYNRKIGIPQKYTWDKLSRLKGKELEDHYSDTLRQLGSLTGMIGRIFVKAQNRIQDPAKLSKLISMIDGENWVIMGVDTKGDIYEGLLEKNAEDAKSGAGQYFTPRALIKAMVECIKPEPKKTIGDPACGTGGFFLASYDFLVGSYKLDKSQKEFLKKQTFKGNEIVASTRRLCLMNLFLHNIGEMTQEQVIISSSDSLKADSGDRFDYVLANPPFGKTSSITITNEKGEQKKETMTYNRQDFWAATSNKQLNFVQHIKTILKTTGKCAVVVPDGVLFEGGAGETVRKKLLETTNLHTILRLPTGIFYKQGVRANVLFFDNKPASKEVQTKEIWFYDYRTNIKHTLKERPLKFEHLKDFIKCYNPENPNTRKETWSEKNPSGRWRKYTYKEIAKKDKSSLDIFWLKEASSNSDNLPEPKELAKDIYQSLQTANQNFKEALKYLG